MMAAASGPRRVGIEADHIVIASPDGDRLIPRDPDAIRTAVATPEYEPYRGLATTADMAEFCHRFDVHDSVVRSGSMDAAVDHFCRFRPKSFVPSGAGPKRPYEPYRNLGTRWHMAEFCRAAGVTEEDVRAGRCDQRLRLWVHDPEERARQLRAEADAWCDEHPDQFSEEGI